MHSMLERQLRKLGLSEETVPSDPDLWLRFLETVERSYLQGEQDRALLERAILISGREMRSLYEDARRDSERRFALHDTLLSGVSDAILTTDLDHRITSWNRAAERCYGWRAIEVIGRKLQEIFPDSAPVDGATFKEIDRNGTYRGEVARRTRSGEEARVESSVSLLHDSSGRVFGHLIIDHDVTDRHRSELELRAAFDAAETATRAKSAFLAEMSHEIRTPMNGVMAMLDLLMERNLGPEAREYVGVAKNSAQALLGLLNDILDFSRIEAGRLELEEIPFDLEEIVEGVAIQNSLAAESKGVELIVRYAPDAPRWIVGDPGRVRQILLNLMANALKFTSRGHVLIRVDGRAQDARAELRVAIEDTGIGFEPETAERIFERFTQADASIARTHGGSGLGLAICRRLIECMGGTIEATGRPNEGSTFRLSFTAALAGTGAPPTTAEAMGECGLAGAKVLLVVPSQPLAQSIREQIEACGGACSLSCAGAKPEAFDFAIVDESASREDHPVLEDLSAETILWIRAPRDRADRTLPRTGRSELPRPVRPSQLRVCAAELARRTRAHTLPRP